jgi:hypothetical protein
VALIHQLASFLPPNATIGLLYDIACQLDRSIAKVSSFVRKELVACSFPDVKHELLGNVAARLSCATAIFHAYAHQFCCQIIYHPRTRTGFGWSNGEGNERVWSLSKDTIGSERIMGVSARLWLN